MKIVIIYLFLSIFVNYKVSADLFSALSNMEILFKTHKNIVDNLQKYVKKERAKICFLQRNLERFQIEDERAMLDKTKYVANPFNAIALLKRLQVDIHFLNVTIQNKTEYKKDRRLTYPSLTDLSGAINAIARLQRTYRLNVTKLANGILEGNFTANQQKYVDNVTPLTSSDCHHIAKVLFKAKDIDKALPWMVNAYEKIKYEGQTEDYDHKSVELIEEIINGYEKLGDNKSTIHWIEKLIQIKSVENNSAASNLEIVNKYEQRIANEGKHNKSQEKMEEKVQDNSTLPALRITLKQNVSISHLFEAYCRNKFLAKTKRRSRWLKCRFLTRTHPYLSLARIKLEQIYLKPSIQLLHDVISDAEIKHLKYAVKNRLQRPKICFPNGTITYSDNYIAKVARIEDKDSQIVMKINQRIEHFTGLSLKYSPGIQAVNYGVGGFHDIIDIEREFYEAPNKSCSESDSSESRKGASVIFFKTDVDQGGAVVFPFLGVTVYPVKGAALYWTNTVLSGDVDYSTMHGSCSVLRGSKWELKKYIQEAGQEFIRPCGIERDAPRTRNPFVKVAKCGG